MPRHRAPHGHWKATTFTGALLVDGITAPIVLDVPLTCVAFQAYIELVLLPTLRRGDTVIMDELQAHKGTEVRRATKAVGGRLHYSLLYSLDCNPMEYAFSKIKAFSSRPQ